VRTLVQNIHELAPRIGREVKLMEVCGTHTMVAFRTGLRQLLPGNVQLLSGPGCPVCVTDTGYIDAAIELCRRPNVIVTTFGDLIRVPGSESSLERERAAGANVQVVYSPTDALAVACENTGKQVVFLGVGFETTVPAVANSIWKAAREGINNFTVLCAHKTMPHAMEALLKDQQVQIDGFLCPGHVSVITGAGMYRFIPEKYGIPCVVSGFEAWDILKSIEMLLAQIAAGRAAVEIEYSRSVTEQGNRAAQRLIAEVFEECDASWRGIGMIPRSGLAIRSEFARHDAVQALGVKFNEARVNPACLCGNVLRGICTPLECRLFGRSCTPANPVGPCMVSSEGACAAYYKFQGRVAA
jgi:hydrogenase expression/formation protein HypD